MNRIRLTKREYEVLSRLAKTDADIANELSISINSVRQITKHLFYKLNVSSRTAAVLKALQYELINIYNFAL